MLLSEIQKEFLQSATLLAGADDPDITDVVLDSRRAGPGTLFVALKGGATDGHTFIGKAVGQGAAAVLASDKNAVKETSIPTLIDQDLERQIGPISAAVHQNPSRSARVVGITGTNGKTTTVEILRAILRSMGKKVGTLGTLGVRVDETNEYTGFTTPRGPELQRTLAMMVQEGCDHIVMEVSSHGLDCHRVDGTDFSVGAFTNLSQDHLDHHGTMKAYAEAKARLFREILPASEHCLGATINLADPFGADLAHELAQSDIPVFAVHHKKSEGAKAYTKNLTISSKGVQGDLVINDTTVPFSCALVGVYNLENIVVASGCAHLLGLSAQEIARGLAMVPAIPGRLEPVTNDLEILTLVDFAHTPDALRRCLESLRALSQGRLICVFGCGGDRDPTKRPIMGQVASQHSDIVIVTSDNPRTEDPERILQEICSGINEDAMQRVHTEVDRRSAIRVALTSAKPGDVVLIAGKGHEKTQIIGTTVTPFSDQDVATEIVRSLERSRDGGTS